MLLLPRLLPSVCWQPDRRCSLLARWPSSCSSELADAHACAALFAVVLLRVSAGLRRGAAAYGDVSSCHFGTRTQELAPFAVCPVYTAGFLHRILCRARWNPGILGNTLLVRLSEKQPFLRDWRTRPPVGYPAGVPPHCMLWIFTVPVNVKSADRLTCCCGVPIRHLSAHVWQVV